MSTQDLKPDQLSHPKQHTLGRNGWAAAVLMAVAVTTAVVAVPTSPAHAVGSYKNAAIADYAMTFTVNNRNQGECRDFVNRVVAHVSGQSGSTQDIRTLGDGYFQSFIRAGGRELKSNSELIPGDIVQRYVDANDLHTWIIVSREANGQFWVVDSNRHRDGLVNFYKRDPFTVAEYSNTRAYRMGSVPTLFRVKNGHTPNRCLDADLFTMGANGTKIQLWDCNANNNQKWYWDGELLRNMAGIRCLDADSFSIGGNGTKLQLWDCTSAQNQRWYKINGGVKIRHAPNRCMDADMGTIGSNGTKVHLWDCYFGNNQKWTFPGTSL